MRQRSLSKTNKARHIKVPRLLVRIVYFNTKYYLGEILTPGAKNEVPEVNFLKDGVKSTYSLLDVYRLFVWQLLINLSYCFEKNTSNMALLPIKLNTIAAKIRQFFISV